MSAIYKYLSPITDSGLFFEKKIIDINVHKKKTVILRYSLLNRYKGKITIPIPISDTLYLDCQHTENIENDECNNIYGEFVIDEKSSNKMYGYGNDHHVTFEASEAKEFTIHFEGKVNPEIVDYYEFMKPDNFEYGLYRIRMSMPDKKFIDLLDVKKYPDATIYGPDDITFK